MPSCTWWTPQATGKPFTITTAMISRRWAGPRVLPSQVKKAYENVRPTQREHRTIPAGLLEEALRRPASDWRRQHRHLPASEISPPAIRPPVRGTGGCAARHGHDRLRSGRFWANRACFSFWITGSRNCLPCCHIFRGRGFIWPSRKRALRMRQRFSSLPKPTGRPTHSHTPARQNHGRRRTLPPAATVSHGSSARMYPPH